MNWSTRRDEIPASDNWKPAPINRKNTKLWCKGKKGRPHKPIIVQDKNHTSGCGPAASWWRNFYGEDWWCRHVEICSVCKKVLRHHLPEQECPTRASVAQ